MEDCYTILGVKPHASAAEIKRAFRQKAKQQHPDLSDSSDSQQNSDFHRLLRAYQILSDAHQRTLFDSVYAARFARSKKTESTLDYRSWLLTKNDEESRSKLVFFDLMHNREDEAVALYKELAASRADFSLDVWFCREDFMDCAFILAEELIFRNELYDAYGLLARVIRMEEKKPYFKHFFPEVTALTRQILKLKMAGNVPDELALDAWEDALDLGFSKKDEAVFLRRMAEAYERIGDREAAAACLVELLTIDPTVRVSVHLKKRLGVA